MANKAPANDSWQEVIRKSAIDNEDNSYTLRAKEQDPTPRDLVGHDQVSDQSVSDLLLDVLKELRIANIHLQYISGIELAEGDDSI